MGKEGPCYHCGVTSTPLWRNGPPDKPVLCNACGSRWRTKGSLTNYYPLHSRGEADDLEVHKVTKIKIVPTNKNTDSKLLKRKLIHDSVIASGIVSDYKHSFRKVMDEDISNRSSSGSAISNPESAAYVCVDGGALTDPAPSVEWDAVLPSRKRTCTNRPKTSPLEKLTQDLCTILHEQQSSPSYFSGSSEEDLLYESEGPMVSVEIGHGSMLIRHPSSVAPEEESETSSISADSKGYVGNEAYSHTAALPVHINNKTTNFQFAASKKSQRNKVQHEKLQIKRSDSSRPSEVDLDDVLNFDEFVKHLTKEEQLQLLKYIPSVDASDLPKSLRRVFNSPQSLESVSSFEQLLSEGVLDLSKLGDKTETCKTQKGHAFFNLTKSMWLEYCNFIKRSETHGQACMISGPSAVASSCSMNIKTLVDDTKIIMRSPGKVPMKNDNENKEPSENCGYCFSPRNLFALPADGSSLMLDPLHFEKESCDLDLLLDVPSNSSFPQAELLHPSTNVGFQQASAWSSSECRF